MAPVVAGFAAGFERDEKIGGRSVHEQTDATAMKGDHGAIVAKRFEHDVADAVVDMNSLEQPLGRLDLARRESIKDRSALVR